MKIVVLNHYVVDGKLIFTALGPVQNKSFDQLDQNGEFSKSLKILNMQRFMIRKSEKIDPKLVNKVFK